MSASRSLPNFYALYLLPWALVSRPIIKFWGIEKDQRQAGSFGAHASLDENMPDMRPDESALTPEEEVGLLHILE